MDRPFHRVPLRNSQRAMQSEAEMLDVLGRVQYVTLALCQGNAPYAVTLSCGLDRSRKALYFHTAFKGLKLDILENNPNVCFTAVEDLGYQTGDCSHKFRSIVGYGMLIRVTDRAEMRHGFEALMDQLEPDPPPLKAKFLDQDSVYAKTVILRLDIHHLTGKASLPPQSSGEANP